MSTYLNTIPKVETESGYIQFVPVNKFKSEKNINAMQVLQNPKTNKLFLSTDSGENFKVQATIDFSKPMSFLIENGEETEACLINVKDGGAKVLATL